MAQRPDRWVEVTPSQFSHEAEGLRLVRDSLPDHAPYRAWSNFEFRDGQGKWHEVDLLVLGRRRLHLVELKHYSGTLRGDDHRWLRDGHRAEDSPLKLARRKAQRLASRLQDGLRDWARGSGHTVPDVRDVIPFVQESVLLHHRDFQSAMSPQAAIDLYGIDGAEASSNLPGISQRLLEPPDLTNPRYQVGGNRDEIIAALMERIGVVQRRQREAGSWVIDEEPLDDGDGWQDWPAFHRVAKDDLARVRFFLTDPGASQAEQRRVRRLAEHEYGVTRRLQHDGLLRPVDMVDADLGVGVVYPADPRFQRLDLWLSDQQALGARGVSVSHQLTLVRQVAEALGYAHGNRVVHRGLVPGAVSVADVAGSLRVLVGDWQSAGALERAGEDASRVVDGVTNLLGATGETPRSARPGTSLGLPRRTEDQLRAEVFQAPEGVFTQQRAQADRVRLDVFALGALAYYVFSGRPPASDRPGLKERLRRDDGLDLAADVPQVPSAVRDVVLNATRPTVAERTPDVRTFLEGLSLAERATGTTVDVELDPLEAPPGTVLDGRWRLERRLGAGSTAVGLLVTDLAAPTNQGRRVLKVALHDAAATRLAGEAEVLAGLNHPRLVRLVEGPVDVGERRALVLESAGDSTLSDELRGRTRTSIDLLERWGTDLLEALVALDAAGVDHRDIKPSNLGVRENRGDRVRHLVLFDFSLSRAGASAVNAGTPPYLDPFLGDRERGRYDSAAERYSAAVVLFEMATGATPVFGDDPATDPASITAEATLDPRAFDPALSEGLLAFFGRALARKAGDRQHTAAEMLAQWRALFTPATTQLDDTEQRVAVATATTPLVGSGLSARALSALEPFGVGTVGDLVAIDAARLTRMSGVAAATRQEVKDRAGQWRDRLGVGVTGRTAGRDASETESSRNSSEGETARRDVAEAAEVLAAGVGGPRAKKPRAAVRLLLGLDDGLDAFASQSAVATALGLKRADVLKQRDVMDRAWARDEPSLDVLETVAHLVMDVLDRSRGVATVDELTAAVFEVFDHPRPTAREVDDRRIARGLLWLGIDRLQAQAASVKTSDDPDDAEGGVVPLSLRRRDGLTRLVATAPALLDAAETLGRTADDLVDQASQAGEPLVPRDRAVETLRAAAVAVLGGEEMLARDGARTLRLAAGTATRAVLSGSNELHDRGLDPAEAVRLALSGMEAEKTERITAHEIVSRVRARFPALPPIPGRPRLDDLVESARPDLVFEARDNGGGYRARKAPVDTTALESRAATTVALPSITSISHGHVSARLDESVSSRSFLALGIDARRIDQAAGLLRSRHGARTVDVTAVLITALKDAAAQAGVPWDVARAADADAPGTRGAQGLGALVNAALPAVDAAIEAAADQAREGSTAVVLLDAAPLARYGHLSGLSRWTDLSVRRRQAVWVVVPQLGGNRGALLDGSPLPLAAPGQFLRVDETWFAPSSSTAPTTTGATA